jgi:hypothetical protein
MNDNSIHNIYKMKIQFVAHDFCQNDKGQTITSSISAIK